jgi:hypothetical protein
VALTGIGTALLLLFPDSVDRRDFLSASLPKAKCTLGRADLSHPEASTSDPMALMLSFELQLQSWVHSENTTPGKISPGPYAIYLPLPGCAL